MNPGEEEEKASVKEPHRKRQKINSNTEITPWKCEYCDKWEDSVTKGTYVQEDVDCFVVERFDVCKHCHDVMNGLRPILDECGNVENYYMVICCPKCVRSNKKCDLSGHEIAKQWQKVAMKYRKTLSNASTTEEWQKALKSMFERNKTDTDSKMTEKSVTTMHFGKHKNKLLHEVPIGYVRWMQRNNVQGVTTQSNEFAKEMRRVWSHIFQ